MDSYLIRIYRRSLEDPQNIVGVVEEIDSGRAHAFHSLSDLCRTLVPPKTDRNRQSGEKKPDQEKDGRKG